MLHYNSILPSPGAKRGERGGGEGKDKKIQGAILLIVLLFLQIFTLLGLYAIQTTTSEIKMANSYWKNQKANTLAQKILYTIEQNLPNQLPPCMIPITPISELSSKLQNGCSESIDTFQYYYVVENLEPETGSCSSTNYFRITLLILSETAKHVWQTTVATPDAPPETCPNTTDNIRPGRQSWRDISFLDVI